MNTLDTQSILAVNTSPHIYAPQTTHNIMRDVIIALVPALLASMYFFGFNAFKVVAISVFGCIASEWIFQKILKRPSTISDMSAIVTGILFAFCLPAGLPWWIILIGACICIILGKQLFGGLGFNLYNPALVGRAVLLASWPQAMTTWPQPMNKFLGMLDTITTATPLSSYKEGIGFMPIYNLFIGNCAGSIGETSALALILGGLYLIARNVISLRIPVSFIGSVYVLSWLLGKDPLYAICAGGVFLGSIFMATDYVTSPITKNGKIIFGIGCGALTVLIRVYGGFPEGVCYAILFMNGLAPLIDRFTQPRPFGVQQ